MERPRQYEVSSFCLFLFYFEPKNNLIGIYILLSNQNHIFILKPDKCTFLVY